MSMIMTVYRNFGRFQSTLPQHLLMRNFAQDSVTKVRMQSEELNFFHTPWRSIPPHQMTDRSLQFPSIFC